MLWPQVQSETAWNAKKCFFVLRRNVPPCVSAPWGFPLEMQSIQAPVDMPALQGSEDNNHPYPYLSPNISTVPQWLTYYLVSYLLQSEVLDSTLLTTALLQPGPASFCQCHFKNMEPGIHSYGINRLSVPWSSLGSIIILLIQAKPLRVFQVWGLYPSPHLVSMPFDSTNSNSHVIPIRFYLMSCP